MPCPLGPVMKKHPACEGKQGDNITISQDRSEFDQGCLPLAVPYKDRDKGLYHTLLVNEQSE